MQTLSNCPICNATQFTSYIACEDFTVSHEVFNIVKCNDCGFKFTNPRPPQDEIGKYYQSEEYISHSNTSKGLVNGLYQLARRFTVKRKKNIIGEYSSGKKVLDYGCGTGNVLHYLKICGYNTVGIEPDDKAREFAKKEFGLSVHGPEQLAVLADGSFDAVTLWHVLEHVHELQSTMDQLVKCLKPGGCLIIAVPNPDSADAKKYGKFWAAYDVPRHLYHFVEADVKKLVEPRGLKHLKTLPMKLDAYYVSMLSEKYRKGGLIGAVWSGFASNLNAFFNGGTYSSRIYVFGRR